LHCPLTDGDHQNFETIGKKAAQVTVAGCFACGFFQLVDDQIETSPTDRHLEVESLG
jgi:hypothetical protein